MEKEADILVKKRTILLVGKIDRKTAAEVRKEILHLSKVSNKEIKIIIDTPGGEAVAALFLYEFISHCQTPISCIVNGECSSSGVVILQGASKRFATQSSFFYLHPLAISFEKEPIIVDEEAEERIKEKLRGARERQKIIYDILIKRTGRTLEEIKAKEKKIIFAKEAKEFGLIEDVLPEDFKI